jgi:SAM-dependent methyltransferase
LDPAPPPEPERSPGTSAGSQPAEEGKPAGASPRAEPAQALDERIERIYAGYSSDARKQRAWSENPGNLHAWRQLARALERIAAPQLQGEGSILDVGCGTGAWLAHLATLVDPQRLCGVDAVPWRLREAGASVPAAHLQHADARSLPFPDESFSLVLMFTILGDMGSREEIHRLVLEAARVLRPGGRLLIYDPRLPNPANSHTRSIHKRDLPLPASSITLTLLPPLARRLGRLTPLLYPLLSALPPLRSHRLWWYTKP